MSDNTKKGFVYLTNDFLEPHLDLKVPIKHLHSPVFLQYCTDCANGSPTAMNEMAEYFAGMNSKERFYRKKFEDKTLTFCRCASNFWRYRAGMKGNSKAKQWIDLWKERNPGKKLPSVLAENYATNVHIPGKLLRALGFLQFDENKKYYTCWLSSDGLVFVGTFVEFYEADDDGFGAEWIYDWCYRDENLCSISGLEDLKYMTFSEATYYLKEYREKAVRLLKR